MNTFLTGEEVSSLTGRKMKAKQIEVLRKMGLPFFVNAAGKPVVPIAAIGGGSVPVKKKKWEMPE